MCYTFNEQTETFHPLGLNSELQFERHQNATQNSTNYNSTYYGESWADFNSTYDDWNWQPWVDFNSTYDNSTKNNSGYWNRESWADFSERRSSQGDSETSDILLETVGAWEGSLRKRGRSLLVDDNKANSVNRDKPSGASAAERFQAWRRRLLSTLSTAWPQLSQQASRK